MAVSFKYWDDCVDPQDMEALWADPEVRSEWINAGETKGQKVHLSRDPDGQPYLTQTEMKAVAGIIVRRHFVSQIDSATFSGLWSFKPAVALFLFSFFPFEMCPSNTHGNRMVFKSHNNIMDMVCAIAELESDRQPIATRYNKKTKETTIGIMQILAKTADWLVSETGYREYEVEGNSKLLYRPFVNVYLGAAYLRWLSDYDQKERSEEFIVRAYKGGTKKATHKSTLLYWRRYLSVKESLPSRKVFEVGPMLDNPSVSSTPVQQTKTTGAADATWDSKVSSEDMEEMWNHPDVNKEWSKSGEKRGKVRFSHDAEKRPYISRVELRVAAETILSKYFSTRRVKAVSAQTALCALAEIVSMRFVNGVGPRPGVMGIDYPTACWLYKYVNSMANVESCISTTSDLGYKAYKVESVDDLTKPFVSMYFGAAYLDWLSQYEGRERDPQFVVQAYLAGPKNVNLQQTGPLWLKFEEALSQYEDLKTEQGACTIL
ncbi:hypothetical protein RHSIM_Rhsim06G0242900 [Rhododendron simsii]|uniref:Transglycosylase SLT domain-containing protein n=1 Tax=Rhododendron simsii TaxID=118357 RepID=A0A834LLR9_RHOSS|nr:hypothetical protein RHSIM_Rhsim06G0242900 [Rhododendron simsii]